MPARVLILGFLVFALGGQAAAGGQRNVFRLPSGNIACHYTASPGYLRCDILSGLRPQPRRGCQLDWTGVGMGRRSRATAVCAGDTIFDRRAPVLAYARSWTRAGIRCTSRRTGLTCRNAGGHGFFLARERWRTW